MSNDTGKGLDMVGIGVSAPVLERAGWRGVFTIEKFDVPAEFYARNVAKSRGTLDDYDAVERLFRGEITWDKLPAHIQLAADAAMRAQHQPYEVSQAENGLLNAGITALWNIFFGNTSAANSGASPAGANAVPTNAQARLGIGDSSTAFAATQTDLQAATNKFYQGMDATFPSVSAQTLSLKATVTGTNADFAWNEFVSDACNGSNSTSTTRSGGATFNRAVSAQGTKASGQSWALTLNITLS